MRILIIDNSSVQQRHGHYFTNSLNGLFIDELTELGNSLKYFQFASFSLNSINSFDLEEHGVMCEIATLKHNKLLNYLFAYLKAWKALRTTDFAYLYYPNSFKYIALLCRLLHKPYGIYIRGMNGLRDKMSHYVYKHAYTIFTVSDYFTNMVNQITRNDIAHTIRPMIPYTDSDVVIGREYAEKEEFSILYLGRIAVDKGLAELIQAVKKLHDLGYKFILKVVGNGEFYPHLSKMVEDMCLQDFVSLEGSVYNNDIKADYYKKADLYILPTYHEGFPRTLYEAMIFGTPIITTFVGGIPALMIDGENCKKIEPKSVDSIVSSLSYAMENYSEMGKMAKSASELVLKIVDRKRLTHAKHLNLLLDGYVK